MMTEREAYIEFLERCQLAFRPFAPIELPEFFKGRAERVELLVNELRTPGRQVAIYGERGVGKTSLALLAYFFARFSDEATHFVRCEQDSTYTTIFGQLLRKAGIEHLPNGLESETSRGGGLRAGPVSLSRGRTTRSRHRAIESARSVGPAMMLDVFKNRDGLLIIDEYDRVRDEPTHTKLAETLKHFSDGVSQTKIIIVGVADTLTELIGQHQSLTRCLAQIKLDRMQGNELAEIIETGEERTGAVFKDAIKRKIVGLSDGFPFYTHLVCKYCAEDAGRVLLRNPDTRVVVADTEYRKAVERAIETAEGTLREDYQAAVTTVKRKTDMYRHVLSAVAYSGSTGVQVQEIAQNVGLLTGIRAKKESLNNYLGPLTKPDKREILVRVRQGYYRFANPLMRAYVRLILERHNLIEEGGQMRFPWMRDV